MKIEYSSVIAHPKSRLVALALSGLLAVSASFVLEGPAQAQIGVGIDIGVPPPPPRYEVVPVIPTGYIWVPGYWEWFHGTHVWRRGHLAEGRAGYRWAPDHWESRGDMHHYEPGRWERDPGYHEHGR